MSKVKTPDEKRSKKWCWTWKIKCRKFRMEFISLCNCRERFSIDTFIEWFPETNILSRKYKSFCRISSTYNVISYWNEGYFCRYWLFPWYIAELKLKQIILEVYQVIYLKILDAMFRMKDDGMMIFDKIIPRLGGFHIVLCMLRSLYCRFKAASTQFLKWLLNTFLEFLWIISGV